MAVRTIEFAFSIIIGVADRIALEYISLALSKSFYFIIAFLSTFISIFTVDINLYTSISAYKSTPTYLSLFITSSIFPISKFSNAGAIKVPINSPNLSICSRINECSSYSLTSKSSQANSRSI